jgi:hypothetical protein
MVAGAVSADRSVAKGRANSEPANAAPASPPIGEQVRHNTSDKHV